MNNFRSDSNSALIVERLHMLRLLSLTTALALLPWPADAQQAQFRNGYMRRDGTYVAPSYQSPPNRTRIDNFSSRGNVNPFTGKPGTVDPYAYRPPRRR